MSRDGLVAGYADLLPKERFILEILETVESDAEVLAVCRKLKENGHLLALDDFTRERQDPLVDLADFIKVDFLATPEDERRSLARWFSASKAGLVAEKLETREAFEEASETGYSHFQGHFFSRPSTVSAKDLPGFKLHYLEILKEIHRPELDFVHLEKIIKRDMALCYKLLRFSNSVHFSWRSHVSSIQRSLVLLGEREAKKWISLIALASMAVDKPEALVVQAMTRARFCELLSHDVGLAHRAEDLFLMGMLSLIDAVLDQPLPGILSQLPVEEDITAALLGKRNGLRDVYEYTLAYENGEWVGLPSGVGVPDTKIYQHYLDAVEWGQQSFRGEILN